MSGREQILGAVRGALKDVPADEPDTWTLPEDGRELESALPPAELAALLAERIDDYKAHVTRCGSGVQAIRRAVGQACARHKVKSLLIPGGLDHSWFSKQLEALTDNPSLSPADLAQVDGVLTGCALAIAETGTIVLDGGPLSGRRAITLVPDLHICVVRSDQIVRAVPEAIAALETVVQARNAPLTFVSGPSATSDIELSRVEGVHGPRRLEVVIAGPAGPAIT